ncbi:MAG: hypothetical protein SCALA702_03470 [Melioribacteraceae bacterium]|nr:MAG: hypothetical protein SCALA702_03470 [Melioribacteraceae bacterium]
MKTVSKILERRELEAIFWLVGLIYLYSIDPYACEHFSFCLFNMMGIDFCPGCGVGNAISLFMHGEFLMSFEHHPLGIPAFLIILYRILSIAYKEIKLKQLLNREKKNGKCTSVNA